MGPKDLQLLSRITTEVSSTGLCRAFKRIKHGPATDSETVSPSQNRSCLVLFLMLARLKGGSRSLRRFNLARRPRQTSA